MKIAFFVNRSRKLLKNNRVNFTSKLSQRDLSTTWIHPQSGYIPTGLVHFVDWSAKRICPNGILPLRGLVRKADMSQRDASTSWICPEGNIFPTKKPRISARLRSPAWTRTRDPMINSHVL